MSDRFHPISMEQLTAWAFTELAEKDSIFGVPMSAIFVPEEADRFKLVKYGVGLESPFGVAAGPQSQMAQNLVVSWLCGARFLELKTVQTLDELDVNKPCIDVQDEGYNVEWSQELKVYESFDEYLRAWVLIHALHRKLGFPGDRPGMIFNMSVGYNLEGILKPNVQWYFEAMKDCSAYKQAYVDIVAEWCPEVRAIEIPDTLSNTITLSTMHGCPPNEIEKICAYLLTERGLHTSVKCNPTLLGPERVRGIINEELGFGDVPIPDAAFGHDLKYADAIPMLHRLRRLARDRELVFGVKLTNTLEVENFRDVFPDDDMMYLSGRALHAATTNLARELSEEFDGDLLISFAGGADCFNVADLLRSGVTSITVCSDLLKSGGYLRLLQYFECLNAALDAAGALDLTDFVCKTAMCQEEFADFGPMFGSMLAAAVGEASDAAAAPALDAAACELLAKHLIERQAREPESRAERVADSVREWAGGRGLDDGQAGALAGWVARTLGLVNLRQYAAQARSEWRSKKDSFRTDRSKTPRPLGLFDCIEAPCVDECPVNQQVPQYMNAVRNGDFAGAVAITREDNPLPAILGRVCDHLCENTCIRTHYDEPLAIRDVKRFIMEHETEPRLFDRQEGDAAGRVAIIGAGPAGLSAAQKLAYAGLQVTIFEMYPYAGGMVGGAIPQYRLPQAEIDQDVEILKRLGVEIRYGVKAGVDFTLGELRADGFQYFFVAVGAQLAKRLNLPGEDSEGVMDALRFLRSVRERNPVPIGKRVGVIGAGDTAMDCVRSAYRLGSEVALIYRRTIDQMPADREEIHGAIEEGIEMVELAKPQALSIENGKLAGLVCTRMEYRGERDASGRKVPREIEGSEFEIPLDTLILAISQHAILDFFGDDVPELSDRGYIQVDPGTFESTVPGVFAGGDVAEHGPSSIVKASADGKLVADAIIARVAARASSGAGEERETGQDEDFDLHALLVRRAHRDWRVPVTHTPLDQRMNFDEPIKTYTPEEAMAEASRCLDCHQICSLCVGVCPNMALMTYESAPFRAALPELRVAAGEVVAGETHEFEAGQRHQIAVLTDFCNECGNCTTFCPTSGEPYRDKPRLYLDREDFEAQTDNAFMLIRDHESPETAAIEARWSGETHRLEVNGDLRYSSPAFTARLQAEDFSLLEVGAGAGVAEGQALSLEPCASMYVVLRGLAESMPQLPWAVPPGAPAAGTRVTHPGYDE